MNPQSALARSALVGALCGGLASAGRSFGAHGWVELGGGAAGENAWFRALAFAGLALALEHASRALGERLSMLALAWGALLGFALHGLLLAAWFEMPNALGVLALAGACWVSTRLLLGAAPADQAGARTFTRQFGAGLAGLAAALALRALERPLALLGGGTTGDDTAFALAFLALVALGASAFGPLLARRAWSSRVLLFGLAATALGALESLRALSTLSQRAGLESFLRSPPWSLDLGQLGMLHTDLLLAARVLLAPAFALGAALACRPPRDTWPWIALGVVAAFARPSPAASGVDAVALLTSESVHEAVSLALAAAVVGVWSLRTASLKARVAATIGLALGAWCAAELPRPRVEPCSPLQRAESRIAFATWRAEGLLTVEFDADGSRVATLDGRRLTPARDEQAADSARLQRVAGAKRVLLVGPLTPARAALFERIGVVEVDRTALYAAALPELERELGVEAAAGVVLAAAAARERLAEYDAVVVPMLDGASASAAQVVPRVSDATLFIAWLDARAPLAGRGWGATVLLAADGAERLSVGLTNRGDVPGGARSAPRLALEGLLEEREQRARAEAARTARRLALATRGGAFEQLGAGLELHFAAQRASSPFETRAQQLELDDAALTLWRDDALARAPGTFERELWRGLAHTLVAKRDIERIDRFLAPLAAQRAPWPELELALARADLEMLEPAQAAARLARALASAPDDVELLLLRGRALSCADDAAGAARELERALELAPGRLDVRRELALARVRAGDARGAGEIRALLLELPGDEELAAHAGPGPYPPLAPRLWNLGAPPGR